MKVLASVALLALAAGLSTPVTAQEAAPGAAAAESSFPMTPQGAADFVAAAEADLFDYSVDASRVNWVNATYITLDTAAKAAALNAVGTDKSVE
jgi:peptidyl-dipeptidase A